MQKTITQLLLGCAVAAVTSAAISRQLNTGAVSTLAGTAASAGSTDGTGAAARFHSPIGVAVDVNGTAYVADQSNHVIRRISAAGVVSTLAGTALSVGSADGTGAAARFKYPYGVAVDAAGTVYVSDQYNHTIRKITPAGVVSTFAGQPGHLGSADGQGSAARLRMPAGLALDAVGNLYVADQGNHTIRKITSAGVVTTLAGRALRADSLDGTGSNARFEQPAGVAVDAAGNVYVTDQENRMIRKVTPAGVVSRFAGQNGYTGRRDTTVPLAARFNFPTGIAIDPTGTLYVADRFNHAIRVISPSGSVTTLAGNPLGAGSANGTGAAARFNCPMGVAVDATGAVYVTDQSNHTVRVIR
jgi:sugar lactone lactonase YvrE